MSRQFCRDVPDPWRCSKSLCKKKFVRIFRSLFLRSFLEILPTSKRGPDELRAESAEKALPEVLSGTRLGVPEKVPKNCRKNVLEMLKKGKIW